MKKTRRVVAAAALSTVGLLFAATPAQADTIKQEKFGNAYVASSSSCPGSRIDNGTWQQGHWNLYYSSANGGTNCLVYFNDSGSTKRMIAWMRTSDYASGASDEGSYQSYAGAIVVRGTAGKCLDYRVEMSGKGKYFDKKHCG